MKIFSTAFALLLLFLLPASATTPFATVSIESNSGEYRVELRPEWDDAVVVFDANNVLLHQISITNVVAWLPPFCGETFQISTAGIDWYQNGIGYIHPQKPLLIVRHRIGRVIVIDLVSGQSILPTKDISDDANVAVAAIALSLLDSDGPSERETGCLHCGHLRVQSAIPRLRELLADDTIYGTGDKYREKVVYYVRKAAAQALRLMGEDVTGVLAEYYPETVTRYSSQEGRQVTLPNTDEALEQFWNREHGKE